MSSKPSQTNMNRPAALPVTSQSSQFGELERVDIFMTNPFGEFGVLEKNVHRVCPGHCILPSSSLCFESFKLKQFSMENPESSSHVSICRLVQVQCWFDDKDLARTERTIVARKSFHHVTDRLVT